VLAKETITPQNDKHTHSLVRVNLQTCSECGRFLVTTYTLSENGDLVLKELELEMKVKSSRIRPYQPEGEDLGARVQESAGQSEIREDTCW